MTSRTIQDVANVMLEQANYLASQQESITHLPIELVRTLIRNTVSLTDDVVSERERQRHTSERLKLAATIAGGTLAANDMPYGDVAEFALDIAGELMKLDAERQGT